MNTENWLTLSGKADIESNSIKYHPLTQKNNFGADENIASVIASNILFESGEISFSITLNETFGLCQLIIGAHTSSEVNVGTIITKDRLFGIIRFNRRTNSWDILGGGIDANTFEVGKEYKIKIIANGSYLSLFVNDILIANCIHETRQSQLQLVLKSSNEILIKDLNVKKTKRKAFVVMQFTDDYNELYNEVIKPVCNDYGLECERADDFHTTKIIIQEIVESITSASVVIADITPDNPNVFYEVGYSHAINKPTILLCDKKRDKLPFDLNSFRTLFYDNTIAGKTKVEQRLRKYLQNIFTK